MSKAYRVEDAQRWYEPESDENVETEIQDALNSLAEGGWELKHIVPQYRTYDSDQEFDGFTGPFFIFGLDE